MSVAKLSKETITPNKKGLLVGNPVYKPFRYPWCYDAWLTQQRIHWLPEEVPLGDDVRDWQKNLNQSEKNLLTQIFRFFTQADVEVNNCYIRHYMNVFKPTEVIMMMAAFASMETVHIAAYSHLLDTVGMPEAEYSSFLKYKINIKVSIFFYDGLVKELISFLHLLNHTMYNHTTIFCKFY